MPQRLNIFSAMANHKGAAVSEPQGEEEGSRKVTNITNFGSSAGAKPTKEAIDFSLS